MKLLTNQHQKPYENAKIYYICNGTLEDEYAKHRKYCKIRDHCHCTGEDRGASYSICNRKHSIP